MLTVSDFAAANELGVRHTFSEGHPPRWGALGDFVERAREGKLTVPVARTFDLEDWRAAVDVGLGGHPGGKLVLLPGTAT